MTRPASELTHRVFDLQIAAKRWSRETQLPTFALHGWLDNAATFDRLAEHLPTIDLVAIDLPGHGKSEHLPNTATYQFVDAVSYVIGFADQFGAEKFNLIGHSMGAAVASLTAGAFSDRIGRLVLLEGLVPMIAEPTENPGRLASYVQARKKFQQGKSPARYQTIAEAVSARHQVSDMSVESVETLVSRGLIAEDGSFSWAADPKLRLPSPTRFSLNQVQAFLEKITVPTMVIRAKPGFDFPESIFRNLVAGIPNSVYKEVKGGHHVHLDDPASVAPLLQQHLTMD